MCYRISNCRLMPLLILVEPAEKAKIDDSGTTGHTGFPTTGDRTYVLSS
jgi:hypothetical protein